MIPFDEIDSRLKALGLDRAWLANTSGRKINSIRVALAPNADQKNRSQILQRALSDAIEKEEALRLSLPQPVFLPDRLSLEASHEQYDAWNRAANAAGLTLREWIESALEKAAEEYRRTGKLPGGGRRRGRKPKSAD